MILLKADAMEMPLRDGTVHCVVTSPPYWGLRDYGLDDKGIGLERTPEEYVAKMVQVFLEVRRVLRDDGTLWLNLGDLYWSDTLSRKDPVESMWGNRPASDLSDGRMAIPEHNRRGGLGKRPDGLKPKDLVGIPWRVAFALQADGWYLRSDIIWSKPNAMPESVRDRPTKAHEYVFLLSKSQRYYYDQDSVREPHKPESIERTKHSWDGERARDFTGSPQTLDFSKMCHPNGRNLRTVWTIPTQPFPGAHFATFPEALAERCIKAGSRAGDVVLDPFGGSGTVARVAVRLGRRAVHLDLAYHELARTTRCTQIQRQAF